MAYFGVSPFIWKFGLILMEFLGELSNGTILEVHIFATVFQAWEIIMKSEAMSQLSQSRCSHRRMTVRSIATDLGEE